MEDYFVFQKKNTFAKKRNGKYHLNIKKAFHKRRQVNQEAPEGKPFIRNLLNNLISKSS